MSRQTSRRRLAPAGARERGKRREREPTKETGEGGAPVAAEPSLHTGFAMCPDSAGCACERVFSPLCTPSSNNNSSNNKNTSER
eukprot:scaffold101032_cov28-Tisochrysis_lutea.AAC.1